MVLLKSLTRLTRNPNSLHELWDEYEFGIGGRKAAKEFTSRERGAVRYNYHRRKVVWDVVAQMVRNGWNAAEACNRIYTIYGRRSSVTSIINKMRKDRKNGGHPGLQNLAVNNL